MASSLKRNIDYLKVLAKANDTQRKAIIQTADEDLILCICECILNVLEGNVRISPASKKKLQRYKSALRQVVGGDCSLDERRDIIEQKGGFLPILLTPILSIAGQLLAETLVGRK